MVKPLFAGIRGDGPRSGEGRHLAPGRRLALRRRLRRLGRRRAAPLPPGATFDASTHGLSILPCCRGLRLYRPGMLHGMLRALPLTQTLVERRKTVSGSCQRTAVASKSSLEEQVHRSGLRGSRAAGVLAQRLRGVGHGPRGRLPPVAAGLRAAAPHHRCAASACLLLFRTQPLL